MVGFMEPGGGAPSHKRLPLILSSQRRLMFSLGAPLVTCGAFGRELTCNTILAGAFRASYRDPNRNSGVAGDLCISKRWDMT